MNAGERLFTEYFAALELYGEYDQGQRESIQDELNRTGRTGYSPKKARIIGRQKWADNAIAKGNIDDQKFAERKVALHGMVSLVAAVKHLDVQVQALAEEVRSLTSQLRDRS